jgi:biopolymer transport protein ExbD
MIKSRHNKKNNWKEEVLWDVTPMIDVAFVLLLFFILTANVTQHIYAVKLPESDPSFAQNSVKKDLIKVTIFEDGTFAFDKIKYKNTQSLKNKILEVFKSNPDAKFMVVPDKKSNSGTLITLLTFFEGNNITNVDILVENGK